MKVEMFHRLQRLSLWGNKMPPRQRPRIALAAAPGVIYAVGDVHGRLDLLLELERLVIQDAALEDGAKWMVFLGDYVDRGPDSAGVVDHLLSEAPFSFKRFCLAGNHEEMMLSYLEAPNPDHRWLDFGGKETLASYGISRYAGKGTSQKKLLGASIPDSHIDFIRLAPSVMSVPGYVFVHAGLRPKIPVDQQSERDLLWIRPEQQMIALEDSSSKAVVVHGHTPVAEIFISGSRINVDTGAYASGVLSCVCIRPGGKLSVLSARIQKK